MDTFTEALVMTLSLHCTALRFTALRCTALRCTAVTDRRARALTPFRCHSRCARWRQQVSGSHEEDHEEGERPPARVESHPLPA